MSFCLHDWIETRRAFTPPPDNFNASFPVGSGTQELAENLMFGLTTVELKCLKCGDLKHLHAKGNVTGPEDSPAMKEGHP